jgi:hypothetical protein
MISKKLLACSALALAVAAPAGASTIDLVSVSGTWISTNPGAPAVSGVGSNVISWGTGTNGPSNYTFNNTATPAGPFDPEEVFELGTFIHSNNPITGTNLATATLQVAWTVAIPSGGDLVSGTSTFVFNHLETPNNPLICADGGLNGFGVNVNGCADRVTFSSGSDLDTSVTVGGVQYFLTLAGFSVGGVSVSEFWTVERQNNPAVLTASFTQRDVPGVIPLPAAGWMLLTALGGLGVAGYRRRKAA